MACRYEKDGLKKKKNKKKIKKISNIWIKKNFSITPKFTPKNYKKEVKTKKKHNLYTGSIR